ncbi:MAG TPA: hypothetical protein VF214_08205 [Edaphobacter sp.]
MHSDPGRELFRRLSNLYDWPLALFFVAAVLLGTGGRIAQAQDDGSTLVLDGGGEEILQSIFVPYIQHAPFSLTLATEWSRPLNNGGTFTVVNSRPIKRDSVGRVYMERWALMPKGSNIPSQMSWIQIADPVAHTLYQCSARQKVCELLTLRDTTNQRFSPDRGTSQNNTAVQNRPGSKTVPLKDGKGTLTLEDLGATYFAGVACHHYRSTTTLNPGVLGNDMPMSTVREYRHSDELGINLTSMVDAPQTGRQTFTVTEINTTEPDPSFFQPPEGYQVVDHRKSKTPAE